MDQNGSEKKVPKIQIHPGISCMIDVAWQTNGKKMEYSLNDIELLRVAIWEKLKTKLEP